MELFVKIVNRSITLLFLQEVPFLVLKYASSMSATAISLTRSCQWWSHCLYLLWIFDLYIMPYCFYLIQIYVFWIQNFPVSEILRAVNFCWLCSFTNRKGLAWEGSLRSNKNYLIYFLKQLGIKGKRKFSASRAVFSCNVLRGNKVTIFLS